MLNASVNNSPSTTGKVLDGRRCLSRMGTTIASRTGAGRKGGFALLRVSLRSGHLGEAAGERGLTRYQGPSFRNRNRMPAFAREPYAHPAYSKVIRCDFGAVPWLDWPVRGRRWVPKRLRFLALVQAAAGCDAAGARRAVRIDAPPESSVG